MSVCALRVDSIDGRCIQLKWSSSTGRDCKPVARMSSFISSFRLLLFFFLLRLLPSPLLCPAFCVLFYFIFRPSYSLSLFLSPTTYILSIPSAFFRFFLLFFFLPHAAGMPVYQRSYYVHLQIVHRWRRPRAAALTIQNEGNGVW